MTSRDFAFWLQGFFEVAKPEAMTPEQVDMVKRHLSLVFKHEIDPSMGGPEKQAELGKVHSPLMTMPSSGWGRQDPLIRC